MEVFSLAILFWCELFSDLSRPIQQIEGPGTCKDTLIHYNLPNRSNNLQVLLYEEQ